MSASGHGRATPGRLNRLIGVILAGKLEEARQILAANWRLNAPPHASTTPRLAFLGHLHFHITAACCEHRPWIGRTPERA